MSITLFYCKKCDLYSKMGAMIRMLVPGRLRPRQGDLVVDGFSYPEDGVPLTELVESRCQECEGLTEVVVLDECPHEWQKLMRDTSCRICGRCGKVQQGRVVFEDVIEAGTTAQIGVGTTAHWRIS